MRLRLGPYEINPPAVLAPMAGITNIAFRRLCREYGAGLHRGSVACQPAQDHPVRFDQVVMADQHPLTAGD